MFTKLKKCSWIKIEVAQACSAQECFQGLHEALGGTEHHHSLWQCKESHYCCCHKPLALLAMWDSGTSTDMSSCDYDLLAKVKEPLWGTRYNIRDELIHIIGRSIQNINKDGHSDGVWCVPNIWQKMINKGEAVLKVHKCCTPVNKAISEISNCCHYFLSNPCTCPG